MHPKLPLVHSNPNLLKNAALVQMNVVTVLTLCILHHSVMHYDLDGNTSCLNEHVCVNTQDIWEDIPYFKN